MVSDSSTDPSRSPGSSGASIPSSGQPTDGYSRIEQVAARTGLTKRTLRYYEEIGLLAPPTRTEGGYRLYSEADIAHLELIKRLRDLLGFSLAEIRDLAEAEEEREALRAGYDKETNPAARLKRLLRATELTRRQLELVEEKLSGLQEMRTELDARLERYSRLRAELEAKITASAPDAGSDEGATEAPPGAPPGAPPKEPTGEQAHS
ncbi:MAG TPA: MerR family transcriptional regulator [Ktedonobacterales bacterium]